MGPTTERLFFGGLLGNLLAMFASNCPPFFIGRSADFLLILQRPCPTGGSRSRPQTDAKHNPLL
jgi:hypothetical protein